MNWLFQLPSTNPVAHAVGVLALVCMAGMALGSAKIFGVGLGTAGVLFAGILTGHFGKPWSKATLDFVKEFGLILFVFTIGLQLGPGFFAALRQQGVKLNALAAVIVVLGAANAPFIGWLAGFDPAAVLGIFSGASVNMPSLRAATQTLSTLPGVAPIAWRCLRWLALSPFPPRSSAASPPCCCSSESSVSIRYGKWQNSLRKIAARLNHSNAEHSR